MKNRIKELRKKDLHLTQKQFADKLGLSENFVWQIEKGERVPSDRTISDICRIFALRCFISLRALEIVLILIVISMRFTAIIT